VYALGVVIHEMLTGRPPFAGESLLDLLFQHATEPPPPMSSLCPDLPAALDEPVLAMLAKRPSARPSSAGEAVAALADKARALGLLETPAAGAPRLAPPPVAPERSRPEDATIGEHAEARSAPASAATGPLAIEVSVASLADPEAVSTAPTIEAAVSPASGTLIASNPPPEAAAPAVSAGARTSSFGGIPAPPVPAPSASRGRVWVLVAAALVAATAGFVALRMRAEATPSPEATPAAAPPAAEVRVRLAVTPDDARVLVDGRPAGRASEPISLPRSSERRAFRIEREGYEAETLWAIPDRDLAFPPVVLRRAPAEAPSASPAAPSAPHTSTTKRPGLSTELDRPAEFDRVKKGTP
jgi:serine/threonine-protein kinase